MSGPRLHALSPRAALAVYGAAGVVIAGFVLLSEVSGHPLAYFTREPAAALLEDTCEGMQCGYVGAFSSLGVLVWSAGAVVCFLVAWLASQARLDAPAARSPFLYAGLLTSLLALDDLFQIHEAILPAYIPNGQLVSYVFYAVAVAVFGLCFRRFLLRTDLLLLAVPLALLAVSVCFDRFFDGIHLVEDGAKFLGIAGWTAYFAGTGLAHLKALGIGVPAAVPELSDAATAAPRRAGRVAR